MSDITTLAKTFTDAHAQDHEKHDGEVAAILGKAESLGRDFATIWPKAKPAVHSVAAFIRFVPGLSAAAPVLNALVAVGDTIASQENAA